MHAGSPNYVFRVTHANPVSATSAARAWNPVIQPSSRAQNLFNTWHSPWKQKEHRSQNTEHRYVLAHNAYRRGIAIPPRKFTLYNTRCAQNHRRRIVIIPIVRYITFSHSSSSDFRSETFPGRYVSGSRFASNACEFQAASTCSRRRARIRWS